LILLMGASLSKTCANGFKKWKVRFDPGRKRDACRHSPRVSSKGKTGLSTHFYLYTITAENTSEPAGGCRISACVGLQCDGSPSIANTGGAIACRSRQGTGWRITAREGPIGHEAVLIVRRPGSGGEAYSATSPAIIPPSLQAVARRETASSSRCSVPDRRRCRHSRC